jgi:acid phosphatase
MPARYYTQTQRIDDKTIAEFFFIDTSPFIGEYTKTPVLPPNPTDHEQKDFAVMSELHANAVSQDTDSQIAWLTAQLAGSTADWKIVVGHHPIYSGGLHGDQPELIARVLPLLHRYGVHVYIAGHDHDLQHLQSDGIDFLCSGAGGAKLYPLKPNTRSKFAQEIFGFMTMALGPTSLRVNLIDDAGKLLYSTTIQRAA